MNNKEISIEEIKKISLNILIDVAKFCSEKLKDATDKVNKILTDAEKEEQAKLRRDYIDAVKGNLKNQLNNIIDSLNLENF